MSYSDGRFQARPLVNAGTITGTATASGTNAVTAADLNMTPPAFVRKSKIVAIRVEPAKAVPANWTLKVIAKNGTNVVGSATGLGAGTAGQLFDLSVDSAQNTFGTNSAVAFTLDGTSTASGQSLGTYNVFMEVQELPA